jgi:hypothetical protein
MMLKKSKITILSFLSLILLTSCRATEYIPSECLIFSPIIIAEQDKESFLEYQDSFSREFLKSLLDYKETRKKICLDIN